MPREPHSARAPVADATTNDILRPRVYFGPLKPPPRPLPKRQVEVVVYTAKQLGIHRSDMKRGKPPSTRQKSRLRTLPVPSAKRTKHKDPRNNAKPMHPQSQITRNKNNEEGPVDPRLTPADIIEALLSKKRSSRTERAAHQVLGTPDSTEYNAAVQRIQESNSRTKLEDLARIRIWSLFMEVYCRFGVVLRFTNSDGLPFDRIQLARNAMGLVPAHVGQRPPLPWARIPRALSQASVIVRGWPLETPVPCTAPDDDSYGITKLRYPPYLQRIATAKLSIEKLSSPLLPNDPVIFDVNGLPVVNGLGQALVSFYFGSTTGRSSDGAVLGRGGRLVVARVSGSGNSFNGPTQATTNRPDKRPIDSTAADTYKGSPSKRKKFCAIEAEANERGSPALDLGGDAS